MDIDRKSFIDIMRFGLMLTLLLYIDSTDRPGRAQDIVLKGKESITAIFENRDSSCTWIAYQDGVSKQKWLIDGPQFKIQTKDGNLIAGTDCHFNSISQDSLQIALQAKIPTPALIIKRVYSFCEDGRTLHITTALRAEKEPVTVRRIHLLDISIPGEKLHLTGPEYVSFPVFGERIFAGVEHPSATCNVQADEMLLYQSPYTEIGKKWVEFPAVVFGSVSGKEFSALGKEGLRKAFIRYLDEVRIKPRDMHIHYNDWWTAPQPSSEDFVLSNIAELKRCLFDPYGFFFDSYALDEGWADRHTLWEINRDNFPDGFNKIRDSLRTIGSRPGLWISPSSLYPNSLDNDWLAEQGYEVTPNKRLGCNPCLAIGGKYQTAFKQTILKHAREANLTHVKFDGFVPNCDVAAHGHPVGKESYLPIAGGLADVFDDLRQEDPHIALEPTCFGYQASPWWLLHVPFIIGPFGDDSPKGRCPSPEWIEAMTTARDIKNLEGREAFLMPGAALQCFDIVVQCPGDFQNHAVMAIGRGRWFISNYINPRFMSTKEWKFFADLMTWARYNRIYLQDPVPVGGDPGRKEAYGYLFANSTRELVCIRNPWIEETGICIPSRSLSGVPREVRALYPRREILARIKPHQTIPEIHLGPYETKFIEIVAIDDKHVFEDLQGMQRSRVLVNWQPLYKPTVQPYILSSDKESFGPSWSCPEGNTREIRVFKLEGELEVSGTQSSILYGLCEGLTIKSAFPEFSLLIDDKETSGQIYRSVGSFFAGGYTEEDWMWFSAPFPPGKHRISLDVKALTETAEFGLFLLGSMEAPAVPAPFDSGPDFPQFREDSLICSYTLAYGRNKQIDVLKSQDLKRTLRRIEGIYLDTMDWCEASCGWGSIQRNLSVKGQTMTMGGQMFHRGIGTHAYSRIVYKRPEDCNFFAATIGCDQKALAGSLVFIVEGDGRQLYKSPLMRAGSEPIEIMVPVYDINEIVLIVEDGGDRINADHGNWANARLLKFDEK